jgi:hypothetical protein
LQILVAQRARILLKVHVRRDAAQDSGTIPAAEAASLLRFHPMIVVHPSWCHLRHNGGSEPGRERVTIIEYTREHRHGLAAKPDPAPGLRFLQHQVERGARRPDIVDREKVVKLTDRRKAAPGK